MTNSRIPLLIDTDPGVDDALALLMAFDDPHHRVVGLSVAAGNVGLEHTVRNALKLCEVAGVSVPVFAGCPTPLLHPAADAAFVHGRDGFGDTNYRPAQIPAEAEHAALAIVRLAHQYSGQLLLVMLAPLTNLALAVRLDPELPSRIARLVVMGGAVNGRGNTTVSAEFNIGFDPEAARIVFEAFPAIEVIDWEAVMTHGLAQSEMDGWLAAGDQRGQFFADISRQTRAWSSERRGDRWFAADALAMAVALQPEGVEEAATRALAIELQGIGRGATIVDWMRRSGQSEQAHLLVRYEQPRFERMVRSALGDPRSI